MSTSNGTPDDPDRRERARAASEPHFTLPPDVAGLPTGATPPGEKRQSPEETAATPHPALEAGQRTLRPHSVPPEADRPTEPTPASDAPATGGGYGLIATGAVSLIAVLALAAGWMMWPSATAPVAEPEPEPEPVALTQPKPAPPAPAPVVVAEPEVEPAPQPVEWAELEPRIAAAYGVHLQLWSERSPPPADDAPAPADPVAKPDQVAAILAIRTDDFAPRDFTVRTPDGSQTSELTAKQLPERDLSAVPIEVGDGLSTVQVFAPIYAPRPTELTELWRVGDTVLYRSTRTISPSYCYGLRPSFKFDRTTLNGHPGPLTMELSAPGQDTPLVQVDFPLVVAAAP